MRALPVRVFVSAIFLSVAAFSVFGFLASFELGVTIGWKIGYLMVSIASLVGTVIPWLFARD